MRKWKGVTILLKGVTFFHIFGGEGLTFFQTSIFNISILPNADIIVVTLSIKSLLPNGLVSSHFRPPSIKWLLPNGLMSSHFSSPSIKWLLPDGLMSSYFSPPIIKWLLPNCLLSSHFSPPPVLNGYFLMT